MPPLATGVGGDVTLFPHRMDVARERMTFVRVKQARLRDSAFLDGRDTFWDGRPIEMPCDTVRDSADPPLHVSRYIFHVGFCGSTLLSRLLDTAGTALVLREPRVLTDIAAYQAALERAGGPDLRVTRAILQASLLLNRRWRAGEPIVVKPSNWINNLVPRLCFDHTGILPLFLTIGRRAYLQSVWRGGPSRISFAARAAVHFSEGREDWSRCVAQVLQPAGDDADKLAALAALSHRFQEELFVSGCEAGGWSIKTWMSFAELRADPIAAAKKAAIILGLPPPDRSGSERWSRVHSKQPNKTFDHEREIAENQSLEKNFGGLFDQALDQLDRLLPPRLSADRPGLSSNSQPVTDKRSAPA